MPVLLNRAARADALVEALAARLSESAVDPFDPELIVVPARGVERWLSQRLSHRLGTSTPTADDGVAANIEFRSPRSLLAEVVGAGDDDPWRPEVMVWSLLAVIDRSLGQPWATALTRHLGASGIHGDSDRRGRRWAVAYRIAKRFDAYAVQRPQMLADWELGIDTDGLGGPIAEDQSWQAELWRQLVEHVDRPSPARRLTNAVQQLRSEPDSCDLPARLSYFGPTQLAHSHTMVIDALAAHRSVELWLPHPSDALWNALSATSATGPVPRDEDDSGAYVSHPLLAVMSRDLRELQRSMPAATADRVVIPGTKRPDTKRPDTKRADTQRPNSLLGRLQDDIEANRPPTVDERLAADDRSIQVHACHGAARQVQVLREVIVGLLADDPTLEPRDIIVMCPDIEQYAPLVEAAFGLGGPRTPKTWHPGQQLQVRLADRSLVQTNPLLAVMGRLLQIAGGRAEASAVLDLAASEPVRRRFGFTDDDLDTVQRWVEQSGVRWAFDADHREAFGLSTMVQNTWQFGLDRLLSGVAVSDDAQTYLSTTLPYDDIGSADVDLVGRFAEFIDRLASTTDQLAGTHLASQWAAVLRDGINSLTDVGYDEQWQLHQAEREIAAMVPSSTAGETTLQLSDIRALVSARWVGRPTRANFRTGSLTVCTMVPMRSVPHRVVCLLGVDDGVFPRAGAADGDDVLQRRSRTGERDVRSEDRQLLLDALMAASEHFVVTYSGAHEVTGQVRPPAVPVGELLDTISLMTPPTHSVVTRHPLQPFDRRNFIAGELGPATPFSFDAIALQGARSASTEPEEPLNLADVVLSAPPASDLDLAELGAFFRAPVREFLRRRVGLDTFDDDDEIEDAIPIEIDGLAEWSIGSRILADRLRGVSRDEALNVEWRRGQLPPGRMGWRRAQQIADRVDPIALAVSRVTQGIESSSVEVDIDLGDGRRLTGTVTGVHGDRIVTPSYSRLSARHYLDAWLPLLALTISDPQQHWTAGTVARDRDGAAMVAFDSLNAAEAREHLVDLVAIYDLGMTQPLRLPVKTSFALVQRGESAPFGARGQWSGRYAERDKDFHPYIWGPAAPFEVLRSGPDELQIDALAQRVWQPILKRAAR